MITRIRRSTRRQRRETERSLFADGATERARPSPSERRSMMRDENGRSIQSQTHLLNRRFGLVTPTPTAPALPILPSSLSVFSHMTSPSSSRPLMTRRALIA